MAIEAPQTYIEVRRANAWADALRSWWVLIDGLAVGKIRRKETRRFPVEPGQRAVSLKMTLWGSPTVDVDVDPGTTVVLACRPRQRNGRSALDTAVADMVDRKAHMELELVSSPAIGGRDR